MSIRKLILAAMLALAPTALIAQQMEPVPDREVGEGQGPFATLVIAGATVIDGTGAPPIGPVDIVVEGNRIAALYPGGAPEAVRTGADRIVDAAGMYALPGLIDTHGHNGDPSKAPQPSYGYKLWLAHGVTTVRGVSFYFGKGADLSDARRSANNTITAPRLIPYAVFGDKWDRGRIDTPAKAREWVRWAKGAGYAGVKFFATPPSLMEAAIDEANDQRFGSVAHLAQMGVAEVTAETAAEFGLGSVTHFYGHMESLLEDNALVRYPHDYNYADEQARFAWVARLADQIVDPGSEEWAAYVDTLLENGVTLNPTFNIYSASRDVMRARSFEWHEKYTLPSLMDFYEPSLSNHGSYYHDWTTEDEVAWRKFYRAWMD